MLYKIVKAHAFIDGNKRTGYELSLAFLRCQKIEIRPPSNQSAINMVIQIAESTASQKETIAQVTRSLSSWAFPILE
ncbi:type II toxin-antitoxin system death-on-curing family toxin [Corynebacterium phocae]|uniref:type II toxin-antitoxin system death-on-curing family toxin n=1 Tax=Corynebacterium phocae TaxID=161895 RepID=UPI0009531C23|nr:type II toxin-antitoxin system death-on-curing family toxin [Corynebacterium phocae]